MRRVMSTSNGMPAISACLGYMLVAVKPGIVFISLRKTSSPATRKSMRAMPAASTARYEASASSLRRAASSGSTSARGTTAAKPSTYLAS
jgi:hypothetical protein